MTTFPKTKVRIYDANPASASRQAARLEGLWRVVNSRNLRGNDLLVATIREAAKVIRTGQRFVGTLGHVDGSDFVVDAVVDDGGATRTATKALFQPGMRVAIAATLQARDLSAGRTQAWDDCQAVADLPELTRTVGIRSQIMTQFVANGLVYVITIGSLEPPSLSNFNGEDYAYLELLGSFLARQLEIDLLASVLGAGERDARHHAERLEALWQIVNDRHLQGKALVFAMMRATAAGMRSDQRFRGVLGRIDGNEVVVVAVGHEPGDPQAATLLPPVGSRNVTWHELLPLSTRTQSWQDIDLFTDATPELAGLGFRAAIATQFAAASATYTLAFISPEPALTPFSAEDVAYLDVLAAALAKQLEIDQLESSLRAQEERMRHHAARLEALWAIVNDPGLSDDAKLPAMLYQAGAAIRNDLVFRATLWRVTGDDVVIEAIAEPRDAVGPFGTHIGTEVPIGDTIVGRLLSDRLVTRSWDDLQLSAEASTLSRAHATRAFIATTFRAGTTQWGLSFASVDVARPPLGKQDHAYIEVLASFFANHMQQRWQFERIQYQQSHDVLTGMLSRSQFRSQARAASRVTANYAIAVVGVDAFREVNQSFGNLVGDALLVEIASALQARTRPGEFIGRIGGDIFGIYLPNAATSGEAFERVHDFAGVFERSFSTGDRNGREFIARTASLGVAGAPRDGIILDDIIAHADAALVRAKRRGHGSIVFYEAGMEGEAHRRAVLHNELVEALVQNQFELYYQPHIELSSGNVTGCEALVRWNHPTRGLLLPGRFIPFAERGGLIGSIDTWVMNKAFANANELGLAQPGMRLYFNLSGRQASSTSLVRAFTDAARRGVKLENIGVEITETDAMRDVEATRHVCRALRRLKVRIAIDDFGTGYSSLSSLKRLPVDIVKIDRSFVSGLEADPHDQTIAETIISISERFGFESLAEGVESPGELAWLRAHGCTYIQGFSVSHPLPFDAFKAWLTGHEPAG